MPTEAPATTEYTSGHPLEKSSQNSHFFSLFGPPGVLFREQSAILKSFHDRQIELETWPSRGSKKPRGTWTPKFSYRFPLIVHYHVLLTMAPDRHGCYASPGVDDPVRGGQPMATANRGGGRLRRRLGLGLGTGWRLSRLHDPTPNHLPTLTRPASGLEWKEWRERFNSLSKWQCERLQRHQANNVNLNSPMTYAKESDSGIRVASPPTE